MSGTTVHGHRLTRLVQGTALFGCSLVLAPSVLALPISQVHQSMDLYVYLEDQFGGSAGEEEDSFSAAFNSPVNVSLSESVGVMAEGAFNTAAGELETAFGATTISASASLSGSFGNFPSNVGGWSLNRIEISFLIKVDEPTPFTYSYAVGPGFGDPDDIYLYGDDGTVFFQYAYYSIPEESGSGVFLPGVTYEFFVAIDTVLFDYLDNLDVPSVSWNTGFEFDLVIPAPGVPAVLSFGFAAGCLRRRR